MRRVVSQPKYITVESCNHNNVRCLNPFELIRKYKCLDCGLVMMCECDKEIGLKYLSHQLSNGTVLETQKRVPVTGGFQPKICRECRGLKPIPHPVSEMPGRTTKIRRYYWRELFFRELEILGEWAKRNGISDPLLATNEKAKTARKEAQKIALEEIKKIHQENPKYEYSELSQTAVFEKYSVQVVDLEATYLKGSKERKVQILYEGKHLTVENFVKAHFKKLEYNSIFLESRPLHVLFGIYMWLVIQDPADPENRIVGFGSREAFDKGKPNNQIWTTLPSDFGSQGYSKRRKKAIKDHLNSINVDRNELMWLFDYWLDYSHDFRQYLWAHHEKDIKKAKKLIQILPPEIIVKILEYLISDYWNHFTGWPDLLVYDDNSYIFVEVKSSNDTLSEDQKRWIKNNYNILKLPFQLVKIHKVSELEE